ncbi:unnamed protein product [Durusdinium trenchii]|uniref:Uncharacterized protein n=1 Tax=Durusdinium trenchii TaxID=1381693 RepID=A0ABP0JAQ9_9DINO
MGVGPLTNGAMSAMKCCTDREKPDEEKAPSGRSASEAPKPKAKGKGKAKAKSIRAEAPKERWADVPTPLEDSVIDKPEEAQSTLEKTKASKEKMEKRIDPSDGRSYTFEQMQRYYKGTYNKRDI